MEPTTAQLSALKEKELELLSAFISVCNQLNLTYFVVGGTLLGAVRHKGFIPWDDDIDIGMRREDYEVFLSKAQALLPDHIFLQTNETDPEYYANYAKLRHNETTFIETAVKNHKINHGIFIDLFPLDYYPDSEKERKRIYWLNKLYTLRIHTDYYWATKTFTQKVKHLILRILCPSIKKTVLRREKLMKACNSGQNIISHCGAWGAKEIVPAQWYQETTTLTFEGLQVSAPKNYHAWLTHYYNDYMQLPPLEKRKSHHDTEVIDPEKTYTEYL